MKTKTIDEILQKLRSIEKDCIEMNKHNPNDSINNMLIETSLSVKLIINELLEEKERKSRDKIFLPKNTKIYLKETERLLNPEKKPLDLMLDGIKLIKEIKELKQGAMRKENDSLREEIKTYQHLTKLLSDKNEQIKKENEQSRLLNKSLAGDVDNLTERNKFLTSENACLYKRLNLYFELYAELRRRKYKKKIDIFNFVNWFVKDEEIEDKIKEAKNEYYRLVNETPIKKLSIDQIRDYVNKNYFGKF